jgi:DNA-binding HxlR family transcriptional regulator
MSTPASAGPAMRMALCADEMRALACCRIVASTAPATRGDWVGMANAEAAPLSADAAAMASELAADLNLAPASVTGRVDGLAHKGLVRRAPSATDRRRVDIWLTEAGWSAWREAMDTLGDVETRIFDVLTRPSASASPTCCARSHSPLRRLPDTGAAKPLSEALPGTTMGCAESR